MGKDKDEIGTPSNPGGPGRTEYPMPEPTEKEIYVPSKDPGKNGGSGGGNDGGGSGNTYDSR